jgi:alkanesulfonate monooxygenase SsuD/methylene tetrahydromethanopterin reductase-like flavin-dependent oxidoreductase (luciferase family)
VQAAELGIGLISGTVLHDQAEDESFGQYQARIIDAYRTTWGRIRATEPPSVAVAASILVGTTPELRETYAAYDLERRTQGIAASRPKGALPPPNQSADIRISPVFHGSPEQVIDAIFNDPGLAAADEIVLFLPPAFSLPQNLRLLKDLAETVAPVLGWTPL